MKQIYAAALACLALAAAAPAEAGETRFACPDLTKGVKLGDCPSEQEMKDSYNASCPEALQKSGACPEFGSYMVLKSKALWSVFSSGQEFLPYISCLISEEKVRASKPIGVRVKCDTATERCKALCEYDNDVYVELRFAGMCHTDTGEAIDCKTDPVACAVTCETGE
ncbi:MAG: hypothetical protein HQL35_00665 [Alphaproteobacteria bacterium]|nr:hypothetical protein [Alphaproteobacteria bacterium]